MQDFADTPTERALLACMCKHGYDVFADTEGMLSAQTFTMTTHQVIYKCLKQIWHEDSEAIIDVPLLMAYANHLGVGDYFRPQKEREYLEKLIIFPTQKDSGRKLAAIIRRKEILGQIYVKLEEEQQHILDADGTEPLDVHISRLEASLLDIANILDSDEAEKVGDGVDEYLDELESNPVDVIGIPTGFVRLDELTGGMLRPGSIAVITARTGEGKSYWAIVVGTYVAKVHKFPVLDLDTELDKKDIINRILAHLSKVNIGRIEKGKFAEKPLEKTKVRKAAEELKAMPFDFKSVSGKPFPEIMSAMRRWLFKTVGFNENGEANPCLIIYDYLKLMSGNDVNKNMSETQIFGMNMSALHDFAKKYSVPILTFVQANRDSIKNDDGGVIAQSDRIGWYASTILWWIPKNEKDSGISGEYGSHKIKILKKRYGKGLQDGDYINYWFDGGISRIDEGQLYSEIRHKLKRKGKDEESDAEDEV